MGFYDWLEGVSDGIDDYLEQCRWMYFGHQYAWIAFFPGKRNLKLSELAEGLYTSEILESWDPSPWLYIAYRRGEILTYNILAEEFNRTKYFWMKEKPLMQDLLVDA